MKKIILWSVVVIAVLIISLFAYVYTVIKKASQVTVGEKISNYESPQSALLIIDLQRDITEKDGTIKGNIQQIDEAITNINKIIDSRKDLIIVYIAQEFGGSKVLEFLSKGALKHGELGTEFDPRILRVNDNYFVKYVSDSFSNHELERFLIENQVDHLYMTGVDAQYCVDKTVKGALNRNYKVTVISDAVGTSTDEKRSMKLKDFSTLGAEVISTAELCKNSGVNEAL